MTLSRRLVAATTTAALLAASIATPVLAKPPVGGCPTGFPIGPWTVEQALETKPPEAEAYFRVYFAKVDKNGNGYVCMRDLPDTPGIPAFATQLADDNAAS